MAGYRQIHTQIWKDEWFIELEPDEKLLFIYLFSNDLASISGLYKIPIRVICNETGLSREFISQTMAKFQDADKIFYQDGVLWIKKMSKYHVNNSPYTQQKIASDTAMIPDCETKRRYIGGMQGVSTPASVNNSNSNSNSNSEEVSAPPPDKNFDDTRIFIEQMTGLPAIPQSIKAIQEIVNMGASHEDIVAGYDWTTSRRTFQYYDQLVGPTRTAMNKRLNNNGKPKPDPHEGLIEYKPGDWRSPMNIPTEEY
jgi:hypothetical protein